MFRSSRVRAASATALLATLVTMPLIRAQIAPAPVAFAALREVQPEPGPSREWRMTLRAASSAESLAQLPPPASRQLAIARVPERDPELTPDSLVVVAVDVAGSTLDWQIVHDPRVIRAESPGADGLLSGRTFTSETAEVRAVLNGGDQTTELRVFKPRWNGSDWLLEPIATARVAR
jgi:hypothetical protein